MVVIADSDHIALNRGTDIFYPVIERGAIYLHAVLKKGDNYEKGTSGTIDTAYIGHLCQLSE